MHQLAKILIERAMKEILVQEDKRVKKILLKIANEGK